MAQVIAIEVSAKTSEAKKNLREVTEQLEIQRKVLIDLEKELLDLETTQKSTSKTNLSAQKELTDKIKEVKKEINLEKLALKDLNQQKRANISIINDYNSKQANGLEIIRGLDEFTGGYVSSLRDVFNGFTESSKGVKNFIGSLSTMQKALIATGVGALVVTLGVIAANWDKISKAVLNATGKNQDYLKEAEKVRIEEESKLKILESQLNILALQGYTEEEIIKIRKRQSEETLKAIEDELKAKKKAQAEEIGFMVSMKAMADQIGLGFLADFILGDEEEREQNKKDIQETEQEIVSLMDKIAGMQLKLNEIKEEDIKNQADEAQRLAEQKEQDAATRIERDVKAEQERGLAINKVRIDNAIAQNKIEEERLKKQADYDKQAKNQRLMIAQETFAAIGALAFAFANDTEKSQKRAFKINKALGIAQTTIQTYQAAQGAYQSQLTIPTPDAPVRAAFAAAAAIASGLARVAQIKKQKFTGGGGSNATPTSIGGNTGGGVSGGTGFNPLTPTVTTPTPIQDVNVVNPQSGVRAYVVENDITNSQALTKTLNRRSRL